MRVPLTRCRLICQVGHHLHPISGNHQPPAIQCFPDPGRKRQGLTPLLRNLMVYSPSDPDRDKRSPLVGIADTFVHGCITFSSLVNPGGPFGYCTSSRQYGFDLYNNPGESQENRGHDLGMICGATASSSWQSPLRRICSC